MTHGLFTILLSFFMMATSWAEDPAMAKIVGQVYERGTRIPLSDINVFILPHKIKAVTDAKGNFIFDSIPEGDIQIVITSSGYQKVELDDYAEAGDIQPRTLYLERNSYSGFETTIVGQKQKRDDSTKTLKQADFANIPGAQGDPVKAVQNLPGVNRVQGGSAQVVIQGSSPQDTKYDIDGHEVPLVFHFGGLTSVVTPEAIEQVDYLSAGYGSEYSRALGGVISLKTRKPEISQRDSKGSFFVDTLKAGVLYEKKLSEDSSLLIGARYSYVGLLLSKVMKSDRFDFTVVPDFADLNATYFKKLNERDELKFVTLVSKDSLGFLLKEPLKEDPILRGTFRSETNFYRLIPQWKRKLDTQRTLSLSAGFGENTILTDFGEIYFHLRSKILSVRGEWDQKMNSLWTTQLGFDNVYTQSNVDLRLPYFNNEGGVSNPFSSSVLRDVNVSNKQANIGMYWRNEITPEQSAWTYLPSLRGDYFSTTKEKFLSPRLGARYKWDDSLTIKGATGLYVQPPQPQEVDSVYGNPNVRSPKATHATIGFDKDLRGNTDRGWVLGSSYFWREFTGLVISSSNLANRDGSLIPEVYNNDGRGKAHGVELLLKAEFAPYSGWIAYTLSKSTRWDPNNSEYNFQYDQTHNLNLVGAIDFGKNWKVSGRFRFVTGNPITPVVGATFDADNDVYIPRRGAIYSERVGNFSQLDVRIDKKFVGDRELWSLYLDIQNLLNAKNPENIRYAYDYRQQENIAGLPIIPSFGLRGEF